MKVVMATFNRDKAREMRALLAAPWLELVPMYEMPGAFAPPESGTSLVENALIKAREAVVRTRLPAIADDTGLEVDALDGAPGIHSARFAGLGASAAANTALLLDKLARVSPERRTARFRTVCVACFPEDDWLGAKPDLIAEGVLEGRILDAPRGTGGFGYDPVFEVAGTGRALAELTAAEKNERSHRALAIRRLLELLAGR